MSTRESAEIGNWPRRRPVRPAKAQAKLMAERAAPVRADRSDRLGYIADMVRQLKIMAAEADCKTLATLLALAHDEALRQQKATQRPLRRP